MASLEWSVDRLAKFFDAYPNATADLAARMTQVQFQSNADREKVRQFFIKYQDRLLYGTDLTENPPDPHARAQNPPDNGQGFEKEADDFWRSDWLYLATANVQHIDAIKADVKGLRSAEVGHRQDLLRERPSGVHALVEALGAQLGQHRRKDAEHQAAAEVGSQDLPHKRALDLAPAHERSSHENHRGDHGDDRTEHPGEQLAQGRLDENRCDATATTFQRPVSSAPINMDSERTRKMTVFSEATESRLLFLFLYWRVTA